MYKDLEITNMIETSPMFRRLLAPLISSGLPQITAHLSHSRAVPKQQRITPLSIVVA